MSETTKEPTSQSRTNQLSFFVKQKIKWICSISRESQMKATLANLRRGIGKVPGELPEALGNFISKFSRRN